MQGTKGSHALFLGKFIDTNVRKKSVKIWRVEGGAVYIYTHTRSIRFYDHLVRPLFLSLTRSKQVMILTTNSAVSNPTAKKRTAYFQRPWVFSNTYKRFCSLF